jgi:hypothetical protein
MTATPAIDGIIEQAVAQVIAQHPTLGPFSSYIKRSIHIWNAKTNWSEEKVADLDQEDRAFRVDNLKDSLEYEADKLEQELENKVLVLLLTGRPSVDVDDRTPYPDASIIGYELSHLDREDIEPACKAFLDRVALHRLMREQELQA